MLFKDFQSFTSIFPDTILPFLICGMVASIAASIAGKRRWRYVVGNLIFQLLIMLAAVGLFLEVLMLVATVSRKTPPEILYPTTAQGWFFHLAAICGPVLLACIAYGNMMRAYRRL